MTISVIIPTYNGAQKIVRALQALTEQNKQDFEVLVVVDGSIDNTVELIQQKNFPLQNSRIIEQKNGGRSISRNRGAKEATGELLVFFDDDTRTLPATLETHLAHHQKFPASLLVGSVPEDFAVMKTDFQQYKAHLSRKWVKDLPKEIPMTKENLFLTAANFSIPKTLFWELGGFDERLNDAEDFDLGVRAFQKGLPIYFDGDNEVWHDDFITCTSYFRRLKQYAQSHEKLLALKPEVYTEYNHYQPKPFSWWKRAIYYFFASSFWVWTIDNWNWLKVLPAKVRYKIYDLITTAHTRYSSK